MRRGRPLQALAMLLPALAGACRPAPPPPNDPSSSFSLDPARLDGATAFEEVRDFIAIGPRHSGSPGALRAADYLAERLRSMNIDPLVDSFQQETPAGPVTFRNVAGVIPGLRDEVLILGSHYDTKSGIDDERFTGGNDSGSSTGLLLAIARQLQLAAPLPMDVLVVFFDGEECMKRYGPADGLHGSRHLAQTLARNRRVAHTRAMILLDMVGDRDLLVTIPRNSSPELVALAFESAGALGVRDRFSLAEGHILDDHVPFLNVGIPAVNLIDFQFGSKPGLNDYWHTTEDTLDKVSPRSLEIVGHVVLEMLNRLMNASGT